MIKKIYVGQLKLGMYPTDLDKVWPEHPFAQHSFLLNEPSDLAKLLESGITEITIDINSGIDTAPENSPYIDKISQEVDAFLAQPTLPISEELTERSPAEEFEHATQLYENANQLMHDLMIKVRHDEKIDLQLCLPIIDDIVASMTRYPSALLPLTQLKTREEYHFQHSVSAAALAVSFGQVLNFSQSEISELCIGGFLHDLGNAKIPGKILHKPEKLDDTEFTLIKKHVDYSAEILHEIRGISEIAFESVAQHHERFDGTGYPRGLKADEISIYGQMMSIIDSYDAICSLRAYSKPTPPTAALRRLFELSGTQFNSRLVEAFIKGVGIYPAGSLVHLASGKLGIVREVVSNRLLQPIVLVIYSCKQKSEIDPFVVDLSTSNDKIIGHESFEKWGINQARWYLTNSALTH
ncbi:MAG: HD-GYP domain-containing protein [Gallionellaceae bacterium]|jgi:HD-GYP domain-containing protein (c-di-GMP phosphodiesterase class II)